jgi:hypothetical protein
MWADFAIEKTAQSKQSPNGRKFAQSGRPVSGQPPNVKNRTDDEMMAKKKYFFTD